jgi:hypothetical protein
LGRERGDELTQDISHCPSRKENSAEIHPCWKDNLRFACTYLPTSTRAKRMADGLRGPLMASVALDRLADRAHALVITGASFRARDRQMLHFAAQE